MEKSDILSKKKMLFAAIVTASILLFFFVMSGCSNSNGTTAFVGEWGLTKMENGDFTGSITFLKNEGGYMTLTLKQDGTGTMNMTSGDAYKGGKFDAKWSAKNSTDAEITINGKTWETSLDNGVLTLENDDCRYSFEKI